LSRFTAISYKIFDKSSFFLRAIIKRLRRKDGKVEKVVMKKGRFAPELMRRWTFGRWREEK
jgi:hypothetical protein